MDRKNIPIFNFLFSKIIRHEISNAVHRNRENVELKNSGFIAANFTAFELKTTFAELET